LFAFITVTLLTRRESIFYVWYFLFEIRCKLIVCLWRNTSQSKTRKYGPKSLINNCNYRIFRKQLRRSPCFLFRWFQRRTPKWTDFNNYEFLFPRSLLINALRSPIILTEASPRFHNIQVSQERRLGKTYNRFHFRS